jgi:hypothetical protein
MLVTARVFTNLTVVCMLAIAFFVAGDISLAAAYKSSAFVDRLLRKIPTEQYLQLVVLPLFGAIAGGLISTAVPIFLDHPLWKPDSRTYIGYALVIIGLFVIVVGPVSAHILYANPKKLIIAVRIERLKDGDWANDNKADVIKEIDQERMAIMKKLNTSNIWFLVFLVLMLASGAVWLVFVYLALGIRTALIGGLCISALTLFGIFARYRVRRKSLRSVVADLRSYREEADKLSRPELPALLPSASADSRHYDQRDLTIAIGGLLVGAILAGLGALLSRGGRRS